MNKYLLLLFLLVLINSYSQNKSNYNLKPINNRVNKCKQENDSLAELAYKASVSYFRKNDFNNAIKYSLIEINTRKQLPDRTRYKKALFNQGLFLYKNRQYFKAINYYNIVIDSFSFDKKTLITYNQLGNVYKKLGDYYQSENFYKKSLLNPELLSIKELFGNYINTAILYDYIETREGLKKEKLFLKKADSLSPFFKLSKNNFHALNFTYAKYFQNNLTFDLKKSKYYYQKVLKKALINNDTSIVIKVCNNIGGLLNKVKNDSAYYYINKGIKLSKVTEQSLPKLYYQLSEYYINKNELLGALKNIDKAISLVIIYKSIQLLKVDDFSFSNKKPLLFRLVKLKTVILLKLYKETGDNEYLISTLKNLFHADKLLDAIKQESIEIQSKLFWQQEASEIYLQGVKVSQLLNKPEGAFYFVEKNKALLLLENISEIQIRKQANIPIPVLENELELKQKINSLENELNKNPKQKDSLENEYYTSKIDLTKFIQSLKKEYPTYYKYKKPIKIINLKDVQSRLEDETIILEYILNENDGYVLVITNKKTSLHKLDSIENFNDKISAYRELIVKPISTKEKQAKYNTISHELYTLLFPFKKSINKKINKIIVVPDYTLQNIPFESLMITENNMDYLINKYEISYTYSLSFDKVNKTKSDKASKDFIGFAPSSFDYNNLSPLKNSIVELNLINQYFKGTIYIDSSATKSNFINNANDSNIIHLATHANDSIAPWIAFKNNPLYLNELYTFQNKADLVVLSACKTSLGKINKGEGVFSLARGFFYGGAKSVVSSLWNVNDKASQEIMSDFYIHLKNGKSKSEALRFAKLEYINSHQLSEQSPFYWSSFILIGDTHAIEINSFSDYYPYFFGLFLIVLGLYLFKKKIM